MGKDIQIRFYFQRETYIEVRHPQSAVIKGELDLSVLQSFTKEGTQERCKHSATNAFVRMLPIHIKEPVIIRGLSFLEYVHEHGIFIAVGHVVWNDILQPS